MIFARQNPKVYQQITQITLITKDGQKQGTNAGSLVS